MSVDRRQVLAAAGPWALAMAMLNSPALAAAISPPRYGDDKAFSFEELRARAKKLASQPYVPPAAPLPIVQAIDYDTVQGIKFRSDRALWANGPGPCPVRLFHVDKFNSYPVRIHQVSNGTAREILYSPDSFTYKDRDVANNIPPDIGFSGFRVMNARDKETDWLAFQGASYFRTSGEDDQYGSSARGIAVNTAMPEPEEFPRFTEFWLEEPQSDERAAITIYALLDGPSVTGAYRIDATKDKVPIMEISAELFARTDVPRLGIAPLTSMFWFGENDLRYASDWRPEIHDSDGLAMWTGSDEHIWRPLTNSDQVRTNSFMDNNPRGFGLIQRDRNFDNYQDDGAFYDRRPGIWVEPIGEWGEGSVQLVEIPTRDEIHDNIVAYWVAKRDVRAGDEMHYKYRLYWQNDEPHPPTNLARIVATRTGRGGVPGVALHDDVNKRKFAIDFVGGPLAKFEQRFDVTPVVSLSRGRIDNAYVIKVVGTDRWRALFDLETEGTDPVDLRCYLKLGDETLTETWLYQWLPSSA